MCGVDIDQCMLNIEQVVDRLDDMECVWHAKSCYSVFCSKTHIDRLKNRKDSDCASDPHSNVTNTASSSTRSTILPTDWKLCIFCQKRKCKGSVLVHQVLTRDCHNTIHTMAASDDTRVLSCRIGKLDLIAYEARYHSACFKLMQRKTHKGLTEENEHNKPFEQAFVELVSRLDTGFADGEVYTLVKVTQHFHALLTSHGVSPDTYTAQNLKSRISKHYGERIQFIQPISKSESLLIIPAMSTADAILAMKEQHTVGEDDAIGSGMLLNDELDDDAFILRAMHHVSAKLKSDIDGVTSHSTYDNLDRNHCESQVPQSLYVFLCMLLSRDDDIDAESVSGKQKTRVLSIAQDIIYASSKGRILTPKHIGLGLSVHHATRSKSLIQMLHASGHCISYEKVTRIETAIAKHQCNQFENNDNLFVPDNLVKLKFVQFAADNIDIIEETIDGKGTFHATQIAAFQRGPAEEVHQPKPLDGSDRNLQGMSQEMNKLVESHYNTGKRAARAIFPEDIIIDHFKKSSTVPQAVPLVIDLAWLVNRMYCNEVEEKLVPSWTAFNQKISSSTAVESITGYMPMIPSPATEYDTIWTAISRCRRIAEYLGQEHTVITVDEGIYCKARELAWCNSDQCQGLILRLGGFHIMLNFLKVIGKHFEDSGLSDVLVESGVYGESVVGTIMNGKLWNRTVRCHKLTYEALWRVLWPLFVQWMHDSNRTFPESGNEIADTVLNEYAAGDCVRLMEAVSAQIAFVQELETDLNVFQEEKCAFPTFQYWLQYLELVSTLLNFIRAEREGNWELHISSFRRMIPWFAVYDHVNYTRWGLVYLADMTILPITAPTVWEEFKNGNFVVKNTQKTFNQLSVDQALEHINKQGKVAGGLVGITRSEGTRERWCLTYNDMARLSESTRSMLGVNVKNESEHIEAGKERMQKDESDVEAIADQFRRFDVFREDANLYCISTNDVATEDIKVQLLSAQSRGGEVADSFVASRLAEGADKSIHAPLQKQNSKTFKHLHSIRQTTVNKKTKNIKYDRSLFQRIILAAEGGRTIDLSTILTHELTNTPQSLTKDDGTLRTTDKYILGHILEGSTSVAHEPSMPEVPTCTVIDAMALVQKIGKPKDAATFGDLAYCFAMNVMSHLRDKCTRVDVVFDDYREKSVKSAARSHRSNKQHKPIRRTISGGDVPLPKQWKLFMDLTENKKDLTNFLSWQLSVIGHESLADDERGEIVIAGGYTDNESATSTKGHVSELLVSNQEEADTRMLLHIKDAAQHGYERVIVHCRDTDVISLLVSFYAELQVPEIWVSAGTQQKRRYIPIQEIHNGLEPNVRSNLLAFHAVTGCDTTSQFAGHGKRTAWKTFLTHPQLLDELGRTPLNDGVVKAVEMFVVKLYAPAMDLTSVDELRVRMFRSKNPESLPPTHDALRQHIARSSYQAMVWYNALVPTPTLPSPFDCGWFHDQESDTVEPVLSTQEAVPKACLELVSCACKRNCSRATCKCRKNGLKCIRACSCFGSLCLNPINDDTL